MARKKDENKPMRPEEIIQKSMEDVMHDSMMPYSEHVILESCITSSMDFWMISSGNPWRT